MSFGTLKNKLPPLDGHKRDYKIKKLKFFIFDSFYAPRGYSQTKNKNMKKDHYCLFFSLLGGGVCVITILIYCMKGMYIYIQYIYTLIKSESVIFLGEKEKLLIPQKD